MQISVEVRYVAAKLDLPRDGDIKRDFIPRPVRAVALSAPGRWSYVYGRLSDANAQDVVKGAAAYATAPDGIVPWRSRPEIFRKQSLARIPPVTVVPEAAE